MRNSAKDSSGAGKWCHYDTMHFSVSARTVIPCLCCAASREDTNGHKSNNLGTYPKDIATAAAEEMKTRRSTMRFSKIAAFALIVGIPSLMSVSLARAASDCSISVTLADWGENSTANIDLAPGGSCLFPIRIRGTVSSSDISQKPARGKLKKLDMTNYEYKAKARYKGDDTFAIKATGQGPTASGTSVITVRATIK